MTDIEELRLICGAMIETYDQAPGKVFVQVIETLARHNVPLSKNLDDEVESFSTGIASIIDLRRKELLDRVHNGYLKVKWQKDEVI